MDPADGHHRNSYRHRNRLQAMKADKPGVFFGGGRENGPGPEIIRPGGLGRQRLATLPASTSDLNLQRNQRINRLFYSVGTVCLTMALTLSMISTQV